jgi:pyruvate ferredoxin oxidoreductase gamma subunit
MKINIRISGLGGQGLVTAANLVGMAATYDGNYSTVVPFFGGEKRLAPTESYVRISSQKIYEKGEVSYPNAILVFHPEVITRGKCFTMPFYAGFQPEGYLIINSDNSLLSEMDLQKLIALKARIIYLPATQIARDVAGTELATNMAMVGGLIGAIEVVTLESLEKAIVQRYGSDRFVASGTTAVLDDVLKRKYTKMRELVEKNMEAVKTAYALVKQDLGGESCTT